MTDNPYAPKVVSTISPTEDAPESEPIIGHLTPSRNAITLLAVLFGGSSVVIALSTTYSLYSEYAYPNYRSGNNLEPEVTWFQCATALLQCFLFLYIAMKLWRYQRCLKSYNSNSDKAREAFAVEHNHFWRSTAVLYVIVIHIILIVDWVL